MSDFKNKIDLIHRNLGIPENYQQKFGLLLQVEEIDLVEIECDIYDRPQQLARVVIKPWQQMKAEAQKEDVDLQLVSAYRSVNRQVQIIENKINAGCRMDEVLKLCAAPGFSEHHSGRALDITTPDCDILTEEFELTDAFLWLRENAHTFSFSMSYPKKNKFGIAYEPWHWFFNNK